MTAVRGAAEALHNWLIKRRIRSIRDPVEKLRYLRRAQGLSSVGKPWRLPHWLRQVAIAAAALVLLFVPRPTVSDADQTVKPDKALLRAPPVSEVWLVEEKDGVEFYSNGLRIENQYAVAGEKRPYPVYDRETLELQEWGSGPVGIVYHTTESHFAPFDSDHNRRLQLVGQWLLEYVRKNSCYHFVIDRFGRIHRVVRESGAANHVGYSVWADSKRIYVNLNPSFLGVALETQTHEGGGGAEVTSAQIHGARVLTQMLRSRYRIQAVNCITHAQVSVAPWNMRIGDHTDWKADFPFAAVGLGENYTIPVPAVGIFGFACDQGYLKSASPELWRGVALGEDNFRHRAAARRVSVDQHRSVVQKRFRDIIKGLDKVVDAVEKTT